MGEIVCALVAAVLALPGGFGAFTTRVEEYMELRRQMERQLPPFKENATPEEIRTYQKGFATVIRKARANARQGQIFTPEAALEFVRVVRSVAPGPRDPAWRAIMETNPRKAAVAVNAPYPEGLPVSTVPPSLLQKLPALPKELQYRFIGSNLILLDSEANLIVDCLPNVLPKR